MLLRTIRYWSTFEAYVQARESLRMAFLLNKYPNKCIDEQFNKTWSKFNINETVDGDNYNQLRQKVIEHPQKEKTSIDYNKYMFIHFTYCLSMKQFPKQFHTLWEKYFAESPINDVSPVLGIGNTKNLQQRLM